MENFSHDIIKEIESRGVNPKPKWYFLSIRLGFWISAILSILIGGVAFAVGEYVFFDNDGMSIQSFKDTPLIEIAKSIPYIWIVILGVFMYFAYNGFRFTRRGYKYATTLVVMGAIFGSVIFGLILNQFDFGQNIHKYLLAHTSFYDGLIHSSEDTQDIQD